jgi:hypothetical protein
MSYRERLRAFPEGAFEGTYHGRRYLIRKETLLKGRLIKLYAEELGGNDFVSLNYYETARSPLLKPCEMPREKVIGFIEGVHLDPSTASRAVSRQ